MKILYQKLISCVVFSVCILNSAQEITLNKIHSGYYRTEYIYGINSMNDGEHYTVLEEEGIVKYSYKTGKKIETILEAKIQDYTFSHDESKVLVLNDGSHVPLELLVLMQNQMLLLMLNLKLTFS